MREREITAQGLTMRDAADTEEGRSVRLLLINGSANGIVRADPGRSAIALKAPRSKLKELLQRPEADRRGVYILSGEDLESAGGQKAYIGETDSMRKRLPIQDKKYEFFDRLVIAVGKDDNLTKTHFCYVESELIRLARRADTATVVNGTDPGFDRLGEADRLEAGHFLDELLLVLPILGFDFFRMIGRETVGEGKKPQESPLFEAKISGAIASGRETDDGFLVLAGSTARVEATESFPEGSKVLRDRLIKEGKLVTTAEGQFYRFDMDVNFTSPSAAASVVGARSASGPQEWKLKGTGDIYKEWRDARLTR